MAEHKFKNTVGFSDRKKKGQHRIRKCSECGCYERMNMATFEKAYQYGTFISRQKVECDKKKVEQLIKELKQKHEKSW